MFAARHTGTSMSLASTALQLGPTTAADITDESGQWWLYHMRLLVAGLCFRGRALPAKTRGLKLGLEGPHRMAVTPEPTPTPTPIWIILTLVSTRDVPTCAE
jgi:hypothetical protein